MSFFMTLHITTCRHFTDIEAHSVVWALWNKIEHQEHQEKLVSHQEAENITE